MIEAYPLCWPVNKQRTPAASRKRAAFNKRTKDPQQNWFNKKQLSVYEAVKRIQSELDAYTKAGHNYRVPPESIIISTNIPVKKDGTPFSNAKEPGDCGAAVYFELDQKQYCLPCDKWDRLADNLAAIAAHLNAMRGIERWGVGESHDVYTGYKAIPQLSSYAIWEAFGLSKKPADIAALHAAYKEQAKKLHPDAPGGSAEAFHNLQEAYKQAKTLYTT